MSKKKPKAPIVVTKEVLGPPIEEDLIGPAQLPRGRDTAPAVGQRLVGAEPVGSAVHSDPPTQPVHERVPKYYLAPLWQERLDKLAQHASVTPDHYLEMLVRRQWTSGSAALGKRHVPGVPEGG